MNLQDRFDSLDLEEIDEYIRTGKQEDLHLEFKTLNDAGLHDQNDKKNLAKALSGFANSDGGLVVWGVDARKNDQIDCAVGAVHIDPLPRLISRLTELTADAVSPTVDGVVHKPIYVTDTAGFAITLIPESESGPHMARLGEHRYYKRSGDTFYKMEHYDVEDMFGRRKKPHLILSARVTRATAETSIFIGIKNIGRGSAKAPYLAFRPPEPFQVSRFGIDGNLNEGLPRLPCALGDSMRRYGADATQVIHPGTLHEIARLDASPTHGIVVVEYEITAEDMRLEQSELSIDLDAMH